jgi:hypothetical protein
VELRGVQKAGALHQRLEAFVALFATLVTHLESGNDVTTISDALFD